MEVSEYHPRQGLYARAVGGFGISDYQLGPYLSSRAVSINASGAVGYAVLPSVIVGLELFTATAPKSGLYFNVNGNWTNKTQSGVAGVGPTVIVYAPFNSHASLTVGVTQHTLSADLPGIQSFSVSSRNGIGGQITVGHDFALPAPMWLGPAVTLYYSRNRGDRFYDYRQITSWGGAVGASFSFQ